MNMDEYVESGLNAHGILEDMTVRVELVEELVEAAHRLALQLCSQCFG